MTKAAPAPPPSTHTDDASAMTPRQIVAALDRYIIGQADAKRAVAIAMRNRWRRQRLDPALAEEVYPKNILMIGPTGVGKTEIARRLAKLARAPFIKVEATKFTEVGYVGKDVESIIRDLTEIALHMTRDQMRAQVEAKARDTAEERILDALVGATAGPATRESFREKLRRGDFNDREVELDIQQDAANILPSFDIPGMPGASMSMINMNEILSKALGGSRTRKKKMKVGESHAILVAEECDKLLDEDKITSTALDLVENHGIVFIDEMDKIASRQDLRGGDVSREGVQRDLLPLIEGTTVTTRHGTVKTDHILFITSGAFHYAKPSDLLAELQGRLPIRVELRALTEGDFVRILVETEACLIRQYEALLATEGLELSFTPDAVEEVARLSFQVNERVENIGARRLHTVMEKLLEDISFTAPERGGEAVEITPDYVRDTVAELLESTDLSKFIL
jgi:ATP-dependent HslUV protease ATP-binding subunit HslU